MRSTLRLVTPLILSTCLVAFCHANCDDCGCVNECSGGKVCKLVCVEKTMSVVCYKCEDEKFCIPDPSCKACKHCELACEHCNCSSNGCAGCSDAPKKSGRWFVWFNWKPTTAQIATKTKLYKKTVTKKVPSYKWVVVDTCQCGACATNFEGADTGFVKDAPRGLDAGDTVAATKKELLRLVKNRTKTAAK